EGIQQRTACRVRDGGMVHIIDRWLKPQPARVVDPQFQRLIVRRAQEILARTRPRVTCERPRIGGAGRSLRANRAGGTLGASRPGGSLRASRSLRAERSLRSRRTCQANGALRTSRALGAGWTGRALLSQRGPIGAFNGGDIRVRPFGRPGRTAEKDRVISGVIGCVVPCSEPVQAFGSRCTRRTSRAGCTLWPLGTGRTFRPLGASRTDWTLRT